MFACAGARLPPAAQRPLAPAPSPDQLACVAVRSHGSASPGRCRLGCRLKTHAQTPTLKRCKVTSRIENMRHTSTPWCIKIYVVKVLISATANKRRFVLNLSYLQKGLGRTNRMCLCEMEKTVFICTAQTSILFTKRIGQGMEEYCIELFRPHRHFITKRIGQGRGRENTVLICCRLHIHCQTPAQHAIAHSTNTQSWFCPTQHRKHTDKSPR